MIIPTIERRFYLSLYIEQKKRESEAQENIQKNSGGTKNNKKTTISGDALKSKLKSGEIKV